MEEEKREIIINEKVDGELTKIEGILRDVILPIKQSTEFINQVLYAPLSDETKEKVIDEIYEDIKKRVDKNGDEVCKDVCNA